MAALDYLRGAGLIVEATADKLRVSPAEQITPELRHYIFAHKAELLAALCAVNEGIAAAPAWIAARDAFNRHALGKCPDCYPPTGRYCVTGAELRAIYDRTPWS